MLDEIKVKDSCELTLNGEVKITANINQKGQLPSKFSTEDGLVS